ncbi:hypothetical protein SLA2020_057000 [Shorea laevis]
MNGFVYDSRDEGLFVRLLVGLGSFLAMEVVYGPYLIDIDARLLFGYLFVGYNGDGVARRVVAMMVGRCHHSAKVGKSSVCVEVLDYAIFI